MTISVVNKNIDSLVQVVDMLKVAIRAKVFTFGSSFAEGEIASNEYVAEQLHATILHKGRDFWYSSTLPITQLWTNYYVNIAYGRGILIARKHLLRNKQLMKETGTCSDMLSVNPVDIKEATHFTYHRDGIESCYKEAGRTLSILSTRLADAAMTSSNQKRGVSRANSALVQSGWLSEFLDLLFMSRVVGIQKEFALLGDADKLRLVLISVMDSRTCKECKKTSGSFYKVSAPFSTLHKHHLCRCVPVPVAKIETSLLQ